MLRMCSTPTLLLTLCLASGAQCARAATYEFRQQLASSRAKAPSALKTPVAAPPVEGAPVPLEPPVVQPPPLPVGGGGSGLITDGTTSDGTTTDGQALYLRSVGQLYSYAAPAGTAFRVQLPYNTFTTNEVNPTLTYEARQANGMPLPSWMRFDNSQLMLSGYSPAGSRQTVSVQVLARNTRGHVAVASLDLVFR